MGKLTSVLRWSTLFALPASATAWCPDGQGSTSEINYYFTGPKNQSDPTDCGGIYRYGATGGFAPVAVESFKGALAEQNTVEVPSPPKAEEFKSFACSGCFTDSCDDEWSIYVGQNEWCEAASDPEYFKTACGVARKVKWVKPDETCNDFDSSDKAALGIGIGGAIIIACLLAACLKSELEMRPREEPEQIGSDVEEPEQVQGHLVHESEFSNEPTTPPSSPPSSVASYIINSDATPACGETDDGRSKSTDSLLQPGLDRVGEEPGMTAP